MTYAADEAMTIAARVVTLATVTLFTKGAHRSPRSMTRRQKRSVGSVTQRAGRSPKTAPPGATETMNRR